MWHKLINWYMELSTRQIEILDISFYLGLAEASARCESRATGGAVTRSCLCSPEKCTTFTANAFTLKENKELE